MGLIDAHCHIYPEKIAEKAVRSIGEFYDIRMGEKGTVTDLIRCLDEAGAARAVVHSVATSPKQVGSINAFIAETVRAHSARLTGLGALHPFSGHVREDVEELVSLGLHGVKLHPDVQAFALDDKRCRTMFGLCEDLGLPMLIHTGDKRFDYSNPNRLIPVLKSFPRLAVVGAHFGGWSIWEEAAEALRSIDNLCVDCSSSFYALDRKTIVRLIRLYGAERVLFGSDYPMWKPKSDALLLQSLPLSENELSAIQEDNAKRVYRIA